MTPEYSRNLNLQQNVCIQALAFAGLFLALTLQWPLGTSHHHLKGREKLKGEEKQFFVKIFTVTCLLVLLFFLKRLAKYQCTLECG